jgi:GTP-binding protein EngB required for normal cell division
MDLKQYEEKKFLLAEIIRSAQAIDTKDEELRSECRDLLSRLAEDQFNLMVVGRFSRGKSTLMNAILGGAHLPTGIVPLTSVITTVRYGSRPQVVLHFKDSGLNREVPLAELADYVTQRGNPGNAKKIAWAEIQLPVEILRRGFFFVDTPGLGSPIIENTLTTERFLPQADAFILVTSYESPLSEEEDRILARISHTNKKLFVVLNKQDTVSPEDREDARHFVLSRLNQVAADIGDVYSLSAKQALAAKIERNHAQFEESGLQALEAELLQFLTEERAQSFLINMYGRTMDLLLHWSASPQTEEQRVFANAAVERLRGLREKITGFESGPGALQLADRTAAVGTYVLDIDKKTGCHICGIMLDAVFRFLSKYQYDLTIKPETQQEHAQRRGFCPLHTWQYEGISSPYGVCASYPPLVHRFAAWLQDVAAEVAEPGGSLPDLRDLQPTQQSCKLCEVRNEAEKRAVAEVAALARDANRESARVPASCLGHLLRVTEALGPGEPARRFMASHARLLERTAEDLQRYALKHDALRRYLTSEEERRASLVALLLIAGHRNLTSPWVIEYLL